MFRRNYSNRSRFHGDRPSSSSTWNNYNSGGRSRDKLPDYDQEYHYGPRTGHSDDWANGYNNFQGDMNFANFINSRTTNSRSPYIPSLQSPNSANDLHSRWPTSNSMNSDFTGGPSHTSESSKIGLPNMRIFQSPAMSSNNTNINSNIASNMDQSYRAGFDGASSYSAFSCLSRDQSSFAAGNAQNAPFPAIYNNNMNQQQSFSGIINTCKLPPYEQVAGLQSRPSSNPFAISTPSKFFGRSEAPMDSITGKPAGIAEASIQPGQFVLLEPFPHQLNAGPMSSSQQYKEQVWKKLRIEVDNDTASLQRNWKLTNYEPVPRDERKYSVWRSSFLLQCDIDNGCHTLYNKDYVPVHLQYPEPDPRDAEYEGRHELYSAAVELWNAYLKNHETKVKIQAKAIKHAIGDHPVASAFVKHNNIDPRQILADMDRAFLQNSHMTKGTALFDFWSLSKGSEPWSVFFAKQDILQMDAHTMFDYQFTDDDKASVLQMNLPTHLQPMYAQFVSSGKSYNQIREELIALETLEKRTRKAQAHAVRDFVHSRYDDNHVPRDAPQSYNWRNRSGRDGRGRSSSPGASRSTCFGSRSHSPDRRGRSHSPKDFSYRSGGYASSHDFRGSSPSRRFGRGERSSSRSPNSTHGAKSGIQSQSFNRDKGKPGQPAGKPVQNHPRS